MVFGNLFAGCLPLRRRCLSIDSFVRHRSLIGHSSYTVCPISFKLGMQASLMLAYTMVSFDYFEVAEIEAPVL